MKILFVSSILLGLVGDGPLPNPVLPGNFPILPLPNQPGNPITGSPTPPNAPVGMPGPGGGASSAGAGGAAVSMCANLCNTTHNRNMIQQAEQRCEEQKRRKDLGPKCCHIVVCNHKCPSNGSITINDTATGNLWNMDCNTAQADFNAGHATTSCIGVGAYNPNHPQLESTQDSWESMYNP